MAGKEIRRPNWFKRHKLITFTIFYFSVGYSLCATGIYFYDLTPNSGLLLGQLYPIALFFAWMVVRKQKTKMG